MLSSPRDRKTGVYIQLPMPAGHSPTEKCYGITELETLAVVWAVSHFHYYFYGHNATIYTDHTAVKAVLEKPNSSGKHARWWSRVYGSGFKQVSIAYQAGRENCNADALSRHPQPTCLIIDDDEEVVQIAAIRHTDSLDEISSLLMQCPLVGQEPVDLATEQGKDPELKRMLDFLEKGVLPDDQKLARKVAAIAPSYAVISGILCFVDPKRGNRKRVLVPRQLHEEIVMIHHSGPLSGHFSAKKVYGALADNWYWEGMFGDVESICKNCPQCVIVSGSGRCNKPPLHPIPVQRPFQIVGVDIMDLPATQQGNKHVVVFQYFTKWPLVYPVPDQKATTLVQLLTKEVIPFFGVPEALLSDRGTNLLSNLMPDVCVKLGIEKLNTNHIPPRM